jgi:ribonuclease VapC
MIIDASAIVAVLDNEEKSSEIIARLDQHEGPIFCTTMGIYEATAGLALKKKFAKFKHNERISETKNLVINLLNKLECEVVSIDDSHIKIVISALAKYGRGSGHPAKLNMGDCFAYATAKSLKVPLLFIGNDFIHTDIKSALKDPTV